MFTGSIVALVTPMTPSGELDEACLGQLVDWHLSEKTAGIVVMGTTGESVTLSADEQQRAIALVTKRVNKRIPVIAGTGTNCTRTTIEKSAEAKKLGVDALLVVVPYYNRPTQQGLIGHFQAVAESTDLPVILYNVPTRTACDMQPDTVIALSDIANIVGIKEATGDLSRLKVLKQGCRPDFNLLSGDDPSSLAFIEQGGHGVISVTANVFPGKMQQMCLAASQGDMKTATRLNNDLAELHKMLIAEPNPIPVKWALQYMNKIPAGIRLPLTPFSETFHSSMKKAIEKAQQGS